MSFGVGFWCGSLFLQWFATNLLKALLLSFLTYLAFASTHAVEKRDKVLLITEFPPQKHLHHTIGLANCMAIPSYKGPASLCADPAEHFYLECVSKQG